MSSPINRTIVYLFGALVLLGLTIGMHYANRPVEIEEFGKVGEEFYNGL